MSTAETLLSVENLEAGYGTSQVLEGLTFSMGTEAVCVVGRNGMGKSTLCKTIMGMVTPTAG
ncbi:MAG: ATP-binding cassette domain-containing protein, partial [Acidimicrobiaceae bacterium]|nr:ATP-binding cassette domain-containing protein [Acidimicrobiaceae bacterium]